MECDKHPVFGEFPKGARGFRKLVRTATEKAAGFDAQSELVTDARVKAKQVMSSAASKAVSASETTSRAAATANEKAYAMLETQWPKIQRFMLSSALPTVRRGLESKDLFEASFSKVHERLPLAIRLVVRRKFFLAFCDRKREHLVAALRARELNGE